MESDHDADFGSLVEPAATGPTDPGPFDTFAPQPLRAPEPVESRWQFWRRSNIRDSSEQYRPPHWWQRVLSFVALAVISLTAGIMVAVAIAATIAAAAIALQSLVS